MKDFIYCDYYPEYATFFICKDETMTIGTYEINGVNDVVDRIFMLSKFLNVKDVYIDRYGMNIAVIDNIFYKNNRNNYVYVHENNNNNLLRNLRNFNESNNLK